MRPVSCDGCQDLDGCCRASSPDRFRPVAGFRACIPRTPWRGKSSPAVNRPTNHGARWRQSDCGRRGSGLGLAGCCLHPAAAAAPSISACRSRHPLCLVGWWPAWAALTRCPGPRDPGRQGCYSWLHRLDCHARPRGRVASQPPDRRTGDACRVRAPLPTIIAQDAATRRIRLSRPGTAKANARWILRALPKTMIFSCM